MTLRATIEIVPYGDESQKREIYRLDVSNIGNLRNEGFGNEICRYKATLFGRVLDYFNPAPGEKWEVIDVSFIEEHNRRDGAVSLIRKAAELLEKQA